jgi:hypothetical protein
VYDLDFADQIILFSLIIAIIGCNFVINQWIIFILGQNNLLDKAFSNVELTLTLSFKLPLPSRSKY